VDKTLSRVKTTAGVAADRSENVGDALADRDVRDVGSDGGHTAGRLKTQTAR
jgi:hypothetical protein